MKEDLTQKIRLACNGNGPASISENTYALPLNVVENIINNHNFESNVLIDILKGLRNNIFYFMTRNYNENKTSSYTLLGELKEMLTDIIKTLGSDNTLIGELDRKEFNKMLRNLPEVAMGNTEEILGDVLLVLEEIAEADWDEENGDAIRRIQLCAERGLKKALESLPYLRIDPEGINLNAYKKALEIANKALDSGNTFSYWEFLDRYERFKNGEIK